jgi:predicted RNA-binding Zn-ribbon protein involved in translation (DUF1610 family)
MWIMTLTGYTAIVYRAIRRDMPKALRQQLLEAGVPVCLACGYGLRGLPCGAERCPECGKKIGDRARTLLNAPIDNTDDPNCHAQAAGKPAR